MPGSNSGDLIIKEGGCMGQSLSQLNWTADQVYIFSIGGCLSK